MDLYPALVQSNVITTQQYLNHEKEVLTEIYHEIYLEIYRDSPIFYHSVLQVPLP